MKLFLLCLLGLVALSHGASSAARRPIVDDFLTKLYMSLPGMIEVTQELLDECWRCSDFDKNGFGIMAHTDPSRCWSYIVCWKDRGVFRIAYEKDCAYGTYFNTNSGPSGIPCTYGAPTAGCVPQVAPTWEIESLPCPYILMDAANDQSRFGIMIRGRKSFVDDCGTGGIWDEATCSCQVHTKDDCKCMVLMDFEGDIQAHGCNGGWVTSEGTLVDISQSGPPGYGNCGTFSGYKAEKNNGDHLKNWALDGVFDNTCTKWRGFKELKVSAWINYAGDSTGIDGILSYGDCVSGPAFFIQLEDGKPCAGLKTQGNPSTVDICSSNVVPSNTWVFIAMVYDQPDLKLYVIPVGDYSDCAGVGGLALPKCQPVATATQTGCVQSEMCGLQVGFTGKDDITQFFVGQIDEVNVYKGSKVFGC